MLWLSTMSSSYKTKFVTPQWARMKAMELPTAPHPMMWTAPFAWDG